MLYNYQDKGFFNSNHSHRSIYDIYKLDCKKSLTIKNIKKDIFIKHFFITIDKFKIFGIPIKTSLWRSYFDKLFRVVRLFSLEVYFKLTQIVKLFDNSEYRKHVLNKISIQYHNKTLLNYIYGWLKA